jgi:hypothetical protein
MNLGMELGMDLGTELGIDLGMDLGMDLGIESVDWMLLLGWRLLLLLPPRILEEPAILLDELMDEVDAEFYFMCS